MKTYITNQEFNVLLCMKVPSYSAQIARRITGLTDIKVERDTIHKIILNMLKSGLVYRIEQDNPNKYNGRPGNIYALTEKGIAAREARYKALVAMYNVDQWVKENEKHVVDDDM